MFSASRVFRFLERPVPRILHQFSNLTSNSHHMRFLKLNFGKNKQISFIAARYARSRPTSPVWLWHTLPRVRVDQQHSWPLQRWLNHVLSLQLPFTNFTTHKSNLTVGVGNLLWLVSIICAKDMFELLSTPNWLLKQTARHKKKKWKFGVKLYPSLLTHCNF